MKKPRRAPGGFVIDRPLFVPVTFSGPLSIPVVPATAGVLGLAGVLAPRRRR